jgi:hypothetical protein
MQEVPTDTTIVTVGSPVYNIVSQWAEQQLGPKVSFSPNRPELVANGRPFPDPTIGMVQVLYDAQHDRRVFYVGGIAEQGTRAGLIYLALNWRELRKNLGKDRVYAGLVQFSDNGVRLTETIH